MRWLAKVSPGESVWAHRALVATLVVFAGVVAARTIPDLGLIPADLERRFVKAELNLVFAAYAAMLGLVVTWRVGQRRDGRHLSLLLVYVATCMSLSVVPSGDAEMWRRVAFAVCWMGAIVEGFKFWTSFPLSVTREGVEGLLGRAHARGWLPSADRFTARTTAALVGTLWGKAAFTVAGFGFAYRLVGPGSHRFNILSDQIRPTGQPVPVEALLDVAGAVVILTIVAVAWTGFRLANEEERRRVLWIVLAQLTVAGFTVTSVTLALLESFTGSAVIRGMLGFFNVAYHPLVWFVDLSGFAVAIFYSGAFDLRPILNKTTVYGGLFLILTFLFATVEEVVETLLTDRLDLPAGLGAWLGAGTIAVAMGPVRERLERFIKGLGHALEKDLHGQPARAAGAPGVDGAPDTGDLPA
ncbi:MAG: hypothetical protein Q8N53_24625 [Longimicrobiales bacterium]|nr:hypothetical protein [Longimicrobiales bacterium]